MSWWAALPAFTAAIVWVLAPGMIVLSPVRLPMLVRIALAGPLSVVVIGIAAIAFASWAFSPLPVLLVTAIAFAAVWMLRGRLPALTLGEPGLRLRLIVPFLAVGAGAIALVAFAGVPEPDRISQTYDNVFHLSATQAILDGYPASALTLRRLIETANTGIAYYPAAWHQLAALTSQASGSGVPVAFNALWIMVQALVWLPGIAWLSQVLFARAGSEVVALSALTLGAAAGAYPYALLTWGTIYPTALAHALLPATIALSLTALRSWWGARRCWLTALIALGLAVLCLALAHPRVLPTAALIGGVWLLALLLGAFVGGIRAGGVHRRRAWRGLVGAIAGLAVLAGVAIILAVRVVGMFDEPIEDRLTGPQAQSVQGVLAGVAQMLGQQTMTADGLGLTWPILPMAILILLGAIWAARSPGHRWIVVATAVLMVLFALAAGSDGVFAKLATGIWYKDRFRLAAAVPVLAVPLAAAGAAWMARRWSVSTVRRSLVGPLAAAAIAIVSAVLIGGTGMTAAAAEVFRMPASAARTAVVSQQQIDFFRGEVAATVPAGERVLGDPWDGSALSGLYAGREPVFPHVNGQWDPHRLALAYRLSDIESDPAVCQALDALRVRYVLYDPHEFGGGDPAGNHFPGPHAAVDQGLFTEVAASGTSRLYRIDQCGPLTAPIATAQ